MKEYAENWRDTFSARATLLALEKTGHTLCHAKDFILSLPESEKAKSMAEEIETELKRLDFLFGIHLK